MKPARLSFPQGWALRQLVDAGGGPVGVFAFAYGRGAGWDWPERAPWFERSTLAALARRQLVTVDGRAVAVTDKGRAALAAWLDIIERRSNGRQ